MRYAKLVVTALLAGCAGRSYTPTLHYTLEPEVQAATATPTDKTLAVRPLDPARPYKQTIVYREGAELGHYGSVEWAELPRDAVTRALADALVASGRFSDVGNALDLNKPDYVLTGELRRFDLRRDTDPWTADCEVRLELRETLGRNLVWADTLSASEPLAENALAALPPAMNRAVARIVETAVAEIANR